MKRCKKCNKALNLKNFYKSSSGVDGFMSECKSCLSKRRKNYYIKNKNKLKSSAKKYYTNNKESISESKSRYEKIKRKSDPLYKLKRNVRTLISNYISRKGYSKKSKTEEILGCSYEELLKHLNNNKYGLKVGQKGLDIDHIIPLSKAYSERMLLSLSTYENLQLLPAKYNRDIKKSKNWDEAHFERWLNN